MNKAAGFARLPPDADDCCALKKRTTTDNEVCGGSKNASLSLAPLSMSFY